MKATASAALAIALAALATNASAQAPTASEMYWNAVRASTGPIGAPQAVPDDPSHPVFPRHRFPGYFAPALPYIEPERIYVPVYVPGPVVYVPAPAATSAPELAPYEPVTPAPATEQTFYVIPGCYGGNVAPEPDSLPAGCDISTLRHFTTRPPVMNRR